VPSCVPLAGGQRRRPPPLSLVGWSWCRLSQCIVGSQKEKAIKFALNKCTTEHSIFSFIREMKFGNSVQSDERRVGCSVGWWLMAGAGLL
jgi:hypothetical protein